MTLPNPMVRSTSSRNNHNMSNFINKILNLQSKLNTHRASDRRNSLGLLLPTTPSTKPLKHFQVWRPAAAGDGGKVDGGGGLRFSANFGSFQWQTTAQNVTLVKSFPMVSSTRQTDTGWESYGCLKFDKFGHVVVVVWWNWPHHWIQKGRNKMVKLFVSFRVPKY